jgi:hypothetical protein
VTERRWPETDSERTAEVLERLAARLREYGDKPIRLANDFLKTSFPSSTERPSSSFEESSDRALSAQMQRDCTDYRAGLRFVQDVVADFDERTARILAAVEPGLVCPWVKCGQRVDPKREKVKYWKGEAPMHERCYMARWRFESRRQAS